MAIRTLMSRHSQYTEHERDQLRAGLIMRMPQLFTSVQAELNQIYDLIRKYSERKEYEVTRTGLQSVYSVVYKYIEIRNGTFMPGSIIPSVDYSHDGFLTNVFEALTGIQRLATSDKDLEISRQIDDCLTKIAIRCTEIRYLANPLREYPQAMLATQYMVQNVEDALKVGLLDIGMQASDSLRAIGLTTIGKHAYTDTALIEGHLKKVAHYGIANNASFLVSHPLEAYAAFLRALIASGADKIIMSSLLDNVAEIIMLYCLAPIASRPMGTDMSFAVGAFLDLTYQTAIPYIYDESLLRLQDKRLDSQGREHLISQLRDLSDELWRFYDRLAKAAAQNESFLIFYIDSNLIHVITRLFHLWSSPSVDEINRNGIRKDVRWLASVYWRIFDYHTEIRRNHYHNVLDHLLFIAYHYNEMGWIPELRDVVSIFISIATSFLEKSKDPYGFEPVRIFEKAAFVCILSRRTEIVDYFVENGKAMFWDKFKLKYPEQAHLLVSELLQIDPVDLLYNSSKLQFEEELLSSFNKEEIEQFVERIRPIFS